MANTNPFSEEDLSTQEEEVQENSSHESSPINERISWDHIARKLLEEQYLLTALELHTELIEAGRENSKLRDFFSNPANFERTRQTDFPNTTLPRTSSCQTFDSLDFARYSDDGERQESDKVAVLEFELRKAQETIRSLRAALTKTAETETELLTSPDASNNKITEAAIEDEECIKPYEKRAINFLVNEYLLSHDYKISSVTFCEENENQDFDDWDDVGLNVSKPPNLLHLYRDYGHHAIEVVEKIDNSTTADLDSEEILKKDEIITHLNDRITNYEERIETMQTENEFLSHRLKSSEKDNQITKFSATSTPAVSPIKPSINQTKTDSIVANAGSDIQFENSAKETIEQTPDSSYSKNDSWEAINQTIPESFSKILFQSAFYSPHDNRIVNEVTAVRDNDDVIPMLGRCLPHIVPNVLLNKREELIPVILAAASLHSDSKERDKLLNILFNLIKKPDSQQRQIILTGCIAFAKNVAYSRLENELLPQCWEQIGHKYFERRMLVAEACGALVPYFSNELRSSLVLSILQQMLDDKSDEVRETSVRSLSLLFAFIQDEGKFGQAGEMLRRGLLDKSENVVKVSKELMLPTYGLWAISLNKLSEVIQTYFDYLQDVIRTALATQVASNSQTLPIDTGKFGRWIDALEEYIPLLFSLVITSAPFLDKISDEPENDNEYHLLDDRSTSNCQLLQLDTIIGSKSRTVKLLAKYEEYISEEWYDSWKEFSWVVDDLLPQLINVVKTVSDEVDFVVDSFCSYCRTLCKNFGFTFVNTKILPKFEMMFSIPNDQIESIICNNHSVYHKCALPVYTYSILCTFLSKYENKLSKFLSRTLEMVAENGANPQSLLSTFAQLSHDSNVHDLLLIVLWEAVVHSSLKVRSLSAKVFEGLLKRMSPANISNRIIPALVTLSSDPEMSVRRATISPLTSIIETVSSREVLDKVRLQLQSFMDDNLYEGEHLLQLELIHSLARVVPNADANFRDEFVLPRMAVMAATNNHNADEAKRFEIAMQLFEAYSSLSCCVMNEQVAGEFLLPGLVCVQRDIAQLAPDRVDIVQSLLRDVQDRLSTSDPRFATSTSFGDMGVTSKMFNTFKDLKDRSGSKLFGKK
ncbi:DgyrCDS5906 [Dimorphilus gyrociliatus]|uniref:DgyrCDS5906 n=1 Tax=Dimorphilus gyrociliatus TaxID=2664684 RepID=A0A7I8VR74_9ANNE|nr:DgyrCDS5906 [Dimorphilus gyrociliatus]